MVVNNTVTVIFTGAPFASAMGLFMAPYHMLPGVLSSLPAMFGAGMPYPGYHGYSFPSPAIHRVPSPNVVTEDDFQKLIQIHRKRRLANEVHYLQVHVLLDTTKN